jgi:hypothetical protein
MGGALAALSAVDRGRVTCGSMHQHFLLPAQSMRAPAACTGGNAAAGQEAPPEARGGRGSLVSNTAAASGALPAPACSCMLSALASMRAAQQFSRLLIPPAPANSKQHFMHFRPRRCSIKAPCRRTSACMHACMRMHPAASGAVFFPLSTHSSADWYTCLCWRAHHGATPSRCAVMRQGSRETNDPKNLVRLGRGQADERIPRQIEY